MPHYCYILFNLENNKTYNGYTNNLERRLRQHNSELVGGAKFTTRQNVKWYYLAIVTSDDMDKILALKMEWMIKYPTRKKPRPKIYGGPKGRLLGLYEVLKNDRFCNLTYNIEIHDDYKEFYTNLQENKL